MGAEWPVVDSNTVRQVAAAAWGDTWEVEGSGSGVGEREERREDLRVGSGPVQMLSIVGRIEGDGDGDEIGTIDDTIDDTISTVDNLHDDALCGAADDTIDRTIENVVDDALSDKSHSTEDDHVGGS